MGVLVDTCVWIDLEAGAISAADLSDLTQNQAAYTSPVVLGELRYGLGISPSDDARVRRQAVLARIERKPILPVDKITAQVYGLLAAHVHGRGGTPRRRTHDIWLASQAIQHGLALLTRNGKDFVGLPGLDLLQYRIPHRIPQ